MAARGLRVERAHLERGDAQLLALDAGDDLADEATLDRLEGEGRVVARYLELNPNGSRRDIAGITNEAGNVVGLMPHPERAIESVLGSADGAGMIASIVAAAGAGVAR